MKITSSILSIPPYISTSWKNVAALHLREGSTILVIVLKNQMQVQIPGLENQVLEAIFEAHSQSLNEESSPKSPIDGPFSFSLPIKPDGPIASLGSAMQHNPEQADLPQMPPDVLKKITAIARAFGLEDLSALPKAEPHCNCVYCQVARALNEEEAPKEEKEEEVTLEDLRFRNWDIKQMATQLYQVTNPLDENEQYQVFLGTPIGCTCGSKNCEHIRAVLSS